MLMSHNTNNTLCVGCCFSILLMFSLGICSDVFVFARCICICICQMYLYLPDVFVLVFVKAASVAEASLFGFWPQQRGFRVNQEAVRITWSKFCDKRQPWWGTLYSAKADPRSQGCFKIDVSCTPYKKIHGYKAESFWFILSFLSWQFPRTSHVFPWLTVCKMAARSSWCWWLRTHWW